MAGGFSYIFILVFFVFIMESQSQMAAGFS